MTCGGRIGGLGRRRPWCIVHNQAQMQDDGQEGAVLSGLGNLLKKQSQYGTHTRYVTDSYPILTDSFRYYLKESANFKYASIPAFLNNI